MAVRQEAISTLGRDRRRISFTTRKAGWRELSRVELPLFTLLALFFAVTLFISPSLEVGSLGIDLPKLALCPLFALTGVPCLMCGITRSFLAMGGLDLTKSFVFHPLGPFFYLSLVVLFLVSAVSMATGRQLRLKLDGALQKGLLRVGAVIIVAAWLVKVVVWFQVGLL